ncbi:ABC transporter ATP-binding protein [Rubellicoccus peritrichatus]|uniref:ABC transporter ATP-binding protein n=1 Tax=Rubellicoccus peritrichatus TaxID=3080537 RepID=A0AAQ3LJ08_9BACT|nr:ABC transporter ATP-binding protein [Puniceicoccus sp. CR14]WOO43039.1 ABC transporter ATP-binding protein [Puniceicoccus sp. CR14]
MSILKAQHISKRLGKVQVLADVSLELVTGRSHALLGKSGSGKTTLARILSSLDKADSGDMKIEKDKRVVLVQQDFVIWPSLTVRENVALGVTPGVNKKEIANIVLDSLSKVRLDGLAERKAGELSYGQQQRVALARALVSGADVLILDEPFAHLDPQGRRAIWRELAFSFGESGVTSLWITHNPADAFPVADMVFCLEDGKIIQQGIPADIYLHPVNRSIAEFSGRLNILEYEDWKELGLSPPDSVKNGQSVGIRPESLTLVSDESGLWLGSDTNESFAGLGYSYSIPLKQGRECLVTMLDRIDSDKRYRLKFSGMLCWQDK